MEKARERVSQATGILQEVAGGTLLLLRAEDLEWAARFLVTINLPFVVINPPELRTELRRLAQSIIDMTDTT
jgi:hypothetical protein